MDSAGPASEPVPGLAECALAERKDLVRPYREDQGFPGEVMEAAVTCLVLPPPVPLICPRLSEALQHRVVGDLNGAPSTTMSSPSSQLLQPVMRITCGLLRRLTVFCSSGPAEK